MTSAAGYCIISQVSFDPFGAILHSSNEPGELSQWLCHDDSTIKIVVIIIITHPGLPLAEKFSYAKRVLHNI